MGELRIARDKQAAWDAALDNAYTAPPDGAARIAVSIYSGGAMGTTGGLYYLGHPVQFNGPEIEGGSYTPVIDTTTTVIVDVLGQAPNVGDVLVASAVAGRWVAERGTTGGPCDCSWVCHGTSPVSFTVTVTGNGYTFGPYMLAALSSTGLCFGSGYFPGICTWSVTVPDITWPAPVADTYCQVSPQSLEFCAGNGALRIGFVALGVGLAPVLSACTSRPYSFTDTITLDPNIFGFNPAYTAIYQMLGGVCTDDGFEPPTIDLTVALEEGPPSTRRDCVCCYDNCTPCPVPKKDLTITWANGLTGSGSDTLVYQLAGPGGVWATGCSGGAEEANQLIFKLFCGGGGQVELRAYYFVSGSCPTGQSAFCSNLQPTGSQLTLSSYTCGDTEDTPFSLTFTDTSLSCPTLVGSGYTSFTVTDPSPPTVAYSGCCILVEVSPCGGTDPTGAVVTISNESGVVASATVASPDGLVLLDIGATGTYTVAITLADYQDYSAISDLACCARLIIPLYPDPPGTCCQSCLCVLDTGETITVTFTQADSTVSTATLTADFGGGGGMFTGWEGGVTISGRPFTLYFHCDPTDGWTLAIEGTDSDGFIVDCGLSAFPLASACDPFALTWTGTDTGGCMFIFAPGGGFSPIVTVGVTQP